MIWYVHVYCTVSMISYIHVYCTVSIIPYVHVYCTVSMIWYVHVYCTVSMISYIHVYCTVSIIPYVHVYCTVSMISYVHVYCTVSMISHVQDIPVGSHAGNHSESQLDLNPPPPHPETSLPPAPPSHSPPPLAPSSPYHPQSTRSTVVEFPSEKSLSNRERNMVSTLLSSVSKTPAINDTCPQSVMCVLHASKGIFGSFGISS